MSLTERDLVVRLESMRQGDQFVCDGVTVTRAATFWQLEGDDVDAHCSSSHVLARTLVDVEREAKAARKREAKMKKKTRMMALWDGVLDNELRDLAAHGAVTKRVGVRRVGEAAQAELNRRAQVKKVEYLAGLDAAPNGPSVPEVYTDEVDVMTEGNRWKGFSLAELDVVVDGLFEIDLTDGATIKMVDGLRAEIKDEHERRERESRAPTYQGPGYYRHRSNGSCVHVVGTAAISGVPYALIGSSLGDPNKWGLPMRTIELRGPDGERVYEYSAARP